MSDTLIKVEKVSKKFCRSLKRSLWYGMQDIGSELVGRRHGGRDGLRPEEFWAVKDVSFELKRGECLGLIGRNGAGKTTLLRMLNGLIKPDGGRIEMRGRVGALIALGAGFNPILSGRENVYVSGAVLGLSKSEIEREFDEIVAFAELADFIDAPVQTYSSGMAVRLGFAISTTLRPEILILDEVLAVGDAAFRHKCYHRIGKLMSESAVIFVSHSMDYIAQTSTSVAMMRAGVIELFADPVDGIAAYHAANSVSGAVWSDGGIVRELYPPILSVDVRLSSLRIEYGGCLTIEVDIECADDIADILFSFTAVNISEQPVMCWHTSRHPGVVALRRGLQRLRFSISPLLLNNGEYHWNFNAIRRGSIEHCIWLMRCGSFWVTSDYRPVGNIPYLADPSMLELIMLPSHQAIASPQGIGETSSAS